MAIGSSNNWARFFNNARDIRLEMQVDVAHIETVSGNEKRPPAITDIPRVIFDLRRQRVILDRDLARLYGVTTARLNEAVKRNSRRFPCDFMFRLSAEENASLMSQFATSKTGRGGHRKAPLAFTEHGAIQAANVLNSQEAVDMGVHVVRAFLRLRELLASNKELSEKLDALERKVQASRLGERDDARHDPAAHEPRGEKAPRHRLHCRS